MNLLALAAPNRAERVAALFRERPNQRVDTFSLEVAGGRRAWRTATSECRTKLGMNIVNELEYVRDASGKVIRIDSFYRWVTE